MSESSESTGPMPSGQGRESTASPQRPRPLWKRLLFTSVMLLMVWGVIEGLAWGYIQFMYTSLGPSMIYDSQRALAHFGVVEEEGADSVECIHPYLGWSLNPDVHPPMEYNGNTYQVNRWGLFGNDDRIPKRSPERVIIGITGGSVATEMSMYGEETFRQSLQADPRFADKEIEIVRIGLFGYKQPQQLMTLNYLLTVGFEFDYVINIDGYNEAALTICENADYGVYYAYPRAWNNRTKNIVDPRVYSQSYDVLRIRATRQAMARRLLNSPLSWSQALNLIWKLRDERLKKELIDLGVDLQQQREANNHGYPSDGPRSDVTDHAEMVKQAVALWERSSRQIEHVCAGNGITYLHMLQPNQYLPGSKPLSHDESEYFIVPDQCYGEMIVECYPLMIEVGRTKLADDLHFVDLTKLFEDHPETIYRDWYCHYNQKGNDLLATRVAQEVLRTAE